MSNRTLKKLQKIGTISSVPLIDVEEGDLSLDEGKSTNKFTLLSGDLSGDLDLNTSLGSGSASLDNDKGNNLKSNKKRKKKNKQKKKKQDKEDEIDRCVREVNEILGEVDTAQLLEDKKIQIEKKQESLLSVSRKYLDPLVEMKRIFGAKVVENERLQQQRQNGKRHNQTSRGKKCVIVGETPSYIGSRTASISMEVDMESEGIVYYKFVHLPSYQKVQFEFSKIVNNIDPEIFMEFLAMHPMHIDALLTCAEIYRLEEDQSSSVLLVESAIYLMEETFHHHFTYCTGKCRMNYKQQENRAFFICIFRHIITMEKKGCTRTALEMCKLLLNLEPETDPLGASLMLDYFAIRAQEYAWLVSLYDWFEGAKNLSMLPNFSFSVPLALYHLSKQKRRPGNSDNSQYKVLSLTAEEMRQRADSMLQDALLMFPGVLRLLLDKCSVKADKAVYAHPYFGPQAQISMTKGLAAIVNLFVGRNFFLWKQQDIIQWLEENVNKTIERIDQNDPLIPEYEEQRKRRYVGPPTPIYRHIILSAIPDVTISLPPEYAASVCMSHDPLPPMDSICGYKHPKVTRNREAESIVSSFFRSIMPTYVPRELDPEEPIEQVVPDIRENVQVILDGLRNLADSIRMENPNIHLDDEPNNQPEGE